MREMKIFKEKECMTEKTKFNFMNHLPTPQPNPSRFALVLLLFMSLFLGSMQGWGQIAQRGTATTNSVATTNGTTLVINKPTGVVTGDVMILSIVQNETDNDNGGLASPTLSGWTIVKDGTIRSNGTGNGDNLWFGSVYYRVSDGTESISFSLAMNSRCDMALGTIVAFSGVATNALKPNGTTGGPFDVVPGSFTTANSATATATGVTIANNNSSLLMIGMVNNDRTYSSWSNSLVELFDHNTTNGDNTSIGAAWTSCNLSGATGDRTVTISASDRNSAILLVLRSASVVTVGSASSTPTACANTTLTNITHATTGASSIGTATGLPAGVSASYSSNTITISGTPTATGTFNYSIPINPGCVSASGTITVLPTPTVVSASSSASTICASGSVDLTSSATSNSNTATTLLSENFNGTATGWTKTNSSTGGTPANAAWTLRPNGYTVCLTCTNSATINSNDASQFYLTDSDNQGQNGNTATTLKSPSFSTFGLSGATLTFYHFYNHYDATSSAVVEVSTDNSTWSTLATYTSNEGTRNGFIQKSISLSSYINEASVYIRFKYTAVWSYYWAIDNVVVTATPATPAISYAWTSSPAGFTSSTQNPTGVSPSATTTYTVTATNNYNCTATATSTVTLNTVTAGSIATAQTICSGGNPAAFTSTAGTGSGTITYRWESNTNLTTPSWSTVASQTGATYDVPSGLTTTTQYRRITISTLNTVACESAATNVVQVTVNPLPSSVITAGSATTFCAGGSVTLTAPAGGSTYDWRINGTIVSSGTSNSYTANQNGLFTVTVTNANTCSSTTSSAVQVTVTANNTAGTASSTPTLCINTALTNITHTTTGATGIGTATGLPAGVTAAWAANTITISGTPTAAGTFNYSIPLTGGCGSVNATGTITVNAAVNASVSIVASATNVCSGTSVTFTATPTNGGTAPTYVWKKNAVTISGATSSTYISTTLVNSDVVTCEMTSNATPCLTGSPATSNAVTMTVTANNTAGTASTTPTLCINTALTNITHTTTGATGIANAGTIGANGLPAGVAASWNGNTITIFGTPSASGTFNYSILLTGGCGSVNATGIITVAAAPSAGTLSGTQTLCSNGTTTLSSTVAGGTWASSATGIATINSTSGAVTGVSAGSASMSYTVTGTGGCSNATATRIVTVTAATTYYADADGDGYGNASSTQAACSQPTGYVTNNTDCNDNSNATNPGASELCNNSDDNCNSQIDEGASNSVSTFITACATYTWSVNNTTYTTSGNYTSGTGCNTQVLHLTITAPALTYYVDADQDGFGAGTGSLFCANPGAGYSTANTDCNDANVSISPMAEELCDGIDNDCNASTTDGLGTTSYFIDADGDTYGNPNITVVSCSAPAGYVSDNTDCDDSNAALYIINTYFSDSDEDSFGDAEAPHEACFLTAGYVMNAQDCDDANAAVNPNATEICNQIDDDCDGLVNDGLTSVDYHFDGDGDGYGSGVAVLSCAPITNYVQNSADCNDSDAAINPNATEICGNTVDEDCNAGDLIPSYYTSRQSGAWTSASTWNKSCDNTTYDLALSAPQDNYAGIVTIATHTVTVGTNDAYVASAGNLNINATGSLIVNGRMSLSQTLVNNGTLTVNNGGSFLQSSPTGVNTGNGSYVVNLNLTGTSANGTAPNGRYWYLGSPMNNTNIYNTFYNPSTMTRVWDYLPATNAWSPIINSSTGVGVNSATNMAVGIGYLYRAGSAQSVTYNGTSSTFNNNVTTPLSFSGIGYKYVANPYTSHLDWKLLTRTGLNVSYWIRNSMNTSYESYNATSNLSTNNGSGQTTQFIPPMQGFWIYAYTTPCSLRMDNGDRVHSSNALHTPMHNQVVRLNLNDGKTSDQAVVYENENASNGIEEYDTDKFMDENHHQVYFLEGMKQVSLDGLNDATAKQKVDMGIQITAAGTYTINAAELGVEEDVMLEDKFTHTFQDMKLNSTYSFTSNAGTFNNRFVLHFTLTPSTETAIETETVTVGETVGESEGVNVYTTTGQQVKVWVTNTTDFQNATVKVYDAIGNMVERKNMTSNELLLDLNTATGVYLVEVTGAAKTFTKKVFISK